jgi:hypothetical protein
MYCAVDGAVGLVQILDCGFSQEGVRVDRILNLNHIGGDGMIERIADYIVERQLEEYQYGRAEQKLGN